MKNYERIKNCEKEIYDIDLKVKYLDEQNVSEDTLLTMTSRLISLGTYEAQIGKSVIHWTSREIEDFIRFLDCKRYVSLSNMFSAVKDYAVFCDKEWKKENNSNVLNNFFADESVFDKENMQRLLNSRKINEGALAYDDYMEILNNEEYPLAGKMMFVLLWNGIPVSKIDEIFTASKDFIDLDNGKIMTKYQNEWIDLSEVEIKIIKGFYKEEESKDDDFEGMACSRVVVSMAFAEEGVYMLCEPKSNMIYHPYVGVVRPSKFGVDSILKNKNKLSLSFATGVARRVFFEMVTDIDRKSMRPKDIIKSGCYNRLINRFGITKEEMAETTKMKTAYKEYIAPYAKPALEDIKTYMESI